MDYTFGYIRYDFGVADFILFWFKFQTKAYDIKNSQDYIGFSNDLSSWVKLIFLNIVYSRCPGIIS